MLVFALIALCIWKQYQLAQGIFLGIVMTATTLIMAYCLQEIELENENLS